MKMDIVEEKDNPLRKRKRYWLSAEHPGKETPSRYEMLPEVVKKLGAKEELVVIAKIFSERGSAKSAIKVFVYNDRKDILPAMVARQDRKVKAFLEKKDKKAEEPAAAPPEDDKPAEEGKEEPKPEGGAEEEAKPAEKEATEGAEESPSEEAPVEEGGKPEEETGAEKAEEKPEEPSEEEETKKEENPKKEE